jgi:predicted dehydrogenase
MSSSTRVGIIGGGWPGAAHARGYRAAGGFSVVAVADLIPARRQKLIAELGPVREYVDAMELIADEAIDAVSICLPTHLHLPVAKAALRAGKHVVLETPPGLSAKEAGQIAGAAAKAGKVLLHGFQRRFGPAELAAKQAIDKGYAGEPYHARATWMRTRGIPSGTGWYTDRSKSGGGALLDLGSHMLDIGWHLLGEPEPVSVFAVTHQRLGSAAGVEDAAFALLRFEGGKSLELGTSWAINQAPSQNGTSCRVYGTKGGIEVYTPAGAVLYRQFGEKGEAKETPLKQPRVAGHAALLRHFRDCILGRAQASVGGAKGVAIMRMIEGMYKSEETGKSVALGGGSLNGEKLLRQGNAAVAPAQSRAASPPVAS